MLIYCPECSEKVSDLAAVCPHCGFPVQKILNEQGKIECPECKATLWNGIKSCPECGYPLEYPNQKLHLFNKVSKNSKASSHNIVYQHKDSASATPIKAQSSTVPNEMMHCPACNKLISKDAHTCPHCGKLIDTRVHCPKCGGTNVSVISNANKVMSTIAFGILAANKVVSHYKCNDCGHKF